MFATSRLRPSLLLGALIFVNACGGRAVNQKTAQEILIELPGRVFDREDVVIDSVTNVGANDAVVETRLRAAFKLVRKSGKWEVSEVRIGNHQWEKVEDIVRTLAEIKRSETSRLLEQVMSAVASYRAENGALPGFSDFVSLTDVLYPTYMNPLVRLDAWRHPISAFETSPTSVRLVSPGPDGVLGNADDVELSRNFR